jgi:flagellin-like protein
MNIKQLLSDDRAVSPVIGVILMVAITVILAAVIGTFVLGLGDQVSQTTPNASFSFDYTNNSSGVDTLEITHRGGDTIASGQLNATVNGAEDGGGAALTLTDDVYDSGDVTAGSSHTLNNNSFNGSPPAVNLASANVRVTWSSDSGDSTAVIGRWSGPDA